MLNLIKLALWNTGTAEVNWGIYENLQKHTIHAIPAPVLPGLQMDPELKCAWKRQIFQQISCYMEYCHFQEKLPVTVPYVILKGTAAAQYYPYPEYRVMGDIDIMTKREDFETARQEFLADGYTIEKELNREIGFVKNGITVELHRFFATQNDLKQAKHLDDLIIENINPSHVLPDMINGLVLLEHISQHLENGLGLRQIMDWMLFVDKCLPDEKWPEFQKIAKETGMETLGIVTTKMCELYLGLPKRNWCQKADENLCAELMEYVLACGNFGNRLDDEKQLSISRGMQIKHPIQTIKNMQKKGKANWNKASSPLLRPFAWLWQAIQLIRENPKLLSSEKQTVRTGCWTV